MCTGVQTVLCNCKDSVPLRQKGGTSVLAFSLENLQGAPAGVNFAEAAERCLCCMYCSKMCEWMICLPFRESRFKP